VSSAASLAVHTAPKNAVPNEPPMERKNVEPLVAAPISFGSTVFCTARTSTCITLPRPAPRTNIASAENQYGESTPMWLIR